MRLSTETGFVLGEHTSSMIDVSYESCHTASGPQDGKYEPASNSGIGCNNSEHSIHFSLEKGLHHYTANKMSDSAFEKRM